MKAKYKIYQVNPETCDYAFEWWDWAKDKFNFKDYNLVYEGEIEYKKDDGVNDILEDLFVMFNTRHPVGFKGHSLSVSDIVELDVSTEQIKIPPQFFYCDAHGWRIVEVGE